MSFNGDAKKESVKTNGLDGKYKASLTQLDLLLLPHSAVKVKKHTNAFQSVYSFVGKLHQGEKLAYLPYIGAAKDKLVAILQISWYPWVKDPFYRNSSSWPALQYSLQHWGLGVTCLVYKDCTLQNVEVIFAAPSKLLQKRLP